MSERFRHKRLCDLAPHRLSIRKLRFFGYLCCTCATPKGTDGGEG